ncbi:MAG: methyltransferase domain-containing protein [Myxococcales bacterium]|nr:methyltransferase domain-containing protein [Myxococcales bacterium]
MPELPLGDSTIDMVVCLESFSQLVSDDRRALLHEAYRVLRPGGLFAAWIRHPPAPDDVVDFWTLEEELSTVYERTYMVAQMPWQGFSLAPVLDAEPEEVAPTLTLDEGLLQAPPEASHYLAVAFRQRPSAKLVERLTAECLLVPVPPADASVPAGKPVELERLRAEASRAEELEQEMGALRLEASRAKEIEQGLGHQLRRAREEIQRQQVRTEELEQDLEGRIKALQAEVHDARVRARVIEDGLEDRVAELQEQAEQAERRAQALEEALEEARDDDSATRLASLRQQLDKSEAAYEAAEADRVELEGQLRTKTTDLTVLTGTVKDLEQSLARMSERAEARARELESQAAARTELQQRLEALADERDELTHQVEVGIAEREGARQLAARVEAELEQQRRRHAEQQEALAAKVAEASRLAGELQALRERLQHQDTMLDQSRTRAEELSATAAKGHEQGRMLAEVARDRDHLREELSRRSAEIDRLEERLWEAREEVQKERLDVVRLSGEVERLREQADRARAAEQSRSREVEQLSKELRKLEVEQADSESLLRSRDEQLERLRHDVGALAGESADLAELRAELQARSRELAERNEQLEQARAREQDALAMARRHEAQLGEIREELDRVRRGVEHARGLSGRLRSELEVKSVEAEQLAASVAELQRQLEEARGARRQADATAEQLQRRLELEASEQEALRRRLRAREQELEEVVATQESSGAELYRMRRELESVAQASDAGGDALRPQLDVEEGPTLLQEQQWPEDAIAEIRRLKGLVAERARQHAEQLARVEALGGLAEGAQRQRLRMLELEVSVRAEEQEHLLGLLESAEQRIWEMTDATDRNAARLAAGLAQLEKHKEQIDELHDELEVTRNLLSAAQARALEQERLLASERAKLARAGIGPDGLPPATRAIESGQEVDELFAELEAGGTGKPMVDLGSASPEPGAPGEPVRDRAESDGTAGRGSSRLVVEPIEDEGEWPDASDELDATDLDKTGPIALSPKPSPSSKPHVTLVRDSANDADPGGSAGKS